MRHDTPAHLWDAQEAAKKAQAIITGLTRDEYLADGIRQLLDQNLSMLADDHQHP